MYQYGNVAVKYRQQQRRVPTRNYTYALPQSHTKRTKAVPQPGVQSNTNALPRKSVFSSTEKITYLTAVLFIIGTLCYLMAQSAAISQTSYDLQTIEKDLAQIVVQNDHLEQEVMALSTPERILQIAQQELGMQAEASKVKILSFRSR